MGFIREISTEYHGFVGLPRPGGTATDFVRYSFIHGNWEANLLKIPKVIEKIAIGIIGVTVLLSSAVAANNVLQTFIRTTDR